MSNPAHLVAETAASTEEKTPPTVHGWWPLTQPSSLLLYPGLRLVDFICGPLVLAAVLMWSHSSGKPGSLASFLSIRITVKNLALLGVFVAGWWLLFAAGNFYHNGKLRTIRTDFTAVFEACSMGTLLVAGFSFMSINGAFGWREVLRFWIVSVVLLCGIRVAARVCGNLIAASSKRVRRCVIVGSGSRAIKLYRWLLTSSMAQYDLIGFIDTAETGTLAPAIRGNMIGSLSDLREILKNHVVDEVLIALPVKSCYEQIQEAIQVCEEVGVQCKLPSDSFSYSIAKPYLERDHMQPFITLRVVRHDYTKAIKRVVDVIGALAGLILLAPLMLAIAIIIRCSSSGPVIFAQKRYGHKKRMFRMYKFRTMTQNAEQVQSTLETANEMKGPVFKIRNDPRITPIGRILRRTSLDELPQLWNVLLGSMSLVGPRPLPVRDVSRFADAWLMRRFSVKPGLTCLWQISGRNDTTFDRWMELDLRYIDQWSLVLDFEIIAKTFAVVLKGSGAS